MHLVAFIIIWITSIYAVNCLYARKLIKIDWTKAALYMSSTALLGMMGEIVIDTIYSAISGRLLWEYHVLPIHHTYTSKYSFFLWAMVGFHVYLLHKTLASKGIRSLNKLALIFSIEAIILDGLVNLSYLLVFGDYIYYYLPGDLFHLTSFQTLPFYLLAGYVAVLMYELFESKPKHFIAFCTSIAALLAFVFPTL